MVETVLIVIKLLLLIKTLLTKLFELLSSFFGFIFKLLFYRILVKIYYQIFRLRNSETIKKSPNKILKERSSVLFVLVLSFLIIFLNFTSHSKANALETELSHTVMSNLIQRDFSYTDDEELIEEGIDLDSILIIGKDKYIEDPTSLAKEDGSNVLSENEISDQMLFAENWDAVLKPKAIITNTGSTDQPQRTEIVYYTVEKGDTVSTIAREFGISVNTILWANNLSSFSLIRPGNKLTILPYSGILYTIKSGDTLTRIANTYGVTEEKIRESNNLGSVLKIGEKLMLPGGKKITYAAAPSSSYTGISVIKDLVSPSSQQSIGNKMLWPTEGHRITQYFSWRHSGLDIGNKTGTPLYAADSGTVTYSGWSTGYGYNVLIDHGGGKKTRYAHSSKLLVKAGDVVDKGQTIALMGSTGWSTGPHIHFEVIINGAKYNPLNYIK